MAKKKMSGKKTRRESQMDKMTGNANAGGKKPKKGNSDKANFWN